MRFVQSMTAMFIGALVLCAGCATQQPAAKNDSMYEVFVRSFASSKPNSAGDLKGLRAKLDYLNDGDSQTDADLNVGIIWLMPIFPTRSYHGYDVADYRDVNPEYGTLADLDALVADAHQRGLRVILDIPFNHCSREHPWFKEAIEDANSAKRGWFFIKPDDGGREDGWRTITNSHGERLKYFGLFGGSMPDLNFDNPEVRAEVKAIAKFWLDRGIDGFRLDAAKHLYGWTFAPTDGEVNQNNTYWREFSEFVYRINPNAILMGEVLGDEKALVHHARGLNELVDEPFMRATRKQIESPQAGFVGRYKSFLDRARAENPKFDSFVYLASHDENPRLMSELENKVPANEVDARYRLGICTLMSMSGRPLLYQGDEVMQRGWKWNGNGPNDRNPGDGSGIYDETLREPLPWTASNDGPNQTRWQPRNRPDFMPHYDKPNDGISVEEETADKRSLLNLVRALATFRRDHANFANAAMTRIIVDSADLAVFERSSEGETYTVMLNFTARPINQAARGAMVFESDGLAKTWNRGGERRNAIDVPPFGMIVLKN